MYQSQSLNLSLLLRQFLSTFLPFFGSGKNNFIYKLLNILSLYQDLGNAFCKTKWGSQFSMWTVRLPHPQLCDHSGVLWSDSTEETSQRESLLHIGPIPFMAGRLEKTWLQQDTACPQSFSTSSFWPCRSWSSRACPLTEEWLDAPLLEVPLNLS